MTSSNEQKLVESCMASLDSAVDKAADFIKYTNDKGQTVVISFDTSDTPLFRTILS